MVDNRLNLQNIIANLRTTPNHYLYIDTLRLNAAGGKINLSGYFNGSNAKDIYMKPDLLAENVDLDKLLFKFNNFDYKSNFKLNDDKAVFDEYFKDKKHKKLDTININYLSNINK